MKYIGRIFFSPRVLSSNKIFMAKPALGYIAQIGNMHRIKLCGLPFKIYSLINSEIR